MTTKRTSAPEPERLNEEQLAILTLLHGSHDERQRGVCLMEAVAWFAGEPHSDAPQCASPVIRAFGIAWNDGIKDDAERTQLLKSFIPRIVGTRAGADIEGRRAFMAMDWIIRVHTPAWLDLKPDLAPHAAALRALPEIAKTEDLISAQSVLTPARCAGTPPGTPRTPSRTPPAMAIFKPVVAQLQVSAADLFSRMIDCGRELLTK